MHEYIGWWDRRAEHQAYQMYNVGPFMNNYPVYIHYVLTEGITRDKSLLWNEFIENIACTFVFRDGRVFLLVGTLNCQKSFDFDGEQETYKVGIQDLLKWA